MSTKSNRNYMIGSSAFLVGYNNHHLYTFLHTPENASVIEVNSIPNAQRNDGFNTIAKVNIDRTVGYVPGIGLKPFTKTPHYVKSVKIKRISGEEVAAKLEHNKRLIVELNGVMPDKTNEVLDAINAKYHLGLKVEDVYNDDVKSAEFLIRFSKTSLAYVGYLPVTVK